jgi:hypothetical protein
MTLTDICQIAKTFVVLVVCFSRRPELRWLPGIDIREPPFQEAWGIWEKIMDEYYYIDNTQGNEHGRARNMLINTKLLLCMPN